MRYDWLLDYGDEVASDLSALHRVDDWRAVEPRRFFALVDQLSAYPGALRRRLQREVDEADRGDSAERALAELVAEGVVAWKR